MSIFRIGIFMTYPSGDPHAGEDLRNSLRKNGFTSTFLVKDYPSRLFKNNRQKSFFFLNNCHVAFFVVEEEVGKGGVVSELEEYKRIVYPKKGKTAIIFEKCAFVKDRIVDCPSTIILPNLTEEKFYVRKFINRNDLPSMALGTATNLIYEMCKKPFKILDPPKFRLKCQVCGEKESKYMCLKRCKKDCTIYHICESDASSQKIRTCTQNGRTLYTL